MSTTDQTARPPFAILADVEGSGQCYVPTVFADDLRCLCAALDWARVFTRDNMPMTAASELEHAARAADALAERARTFAAQSRAQALAKGM